MSTLPSAGSAQLCTFTHSSTVNVYNVLRVEPRTLEGPGCNPGAGWVHALCESPQDVHCPSSDSVLKGEVLRCLETLFSVSHFLTLAKNSLSHSAVHQKQNICMPEENVYVGIIILEIKFSSRFERLFSLQLRSLLRK